MRTAYFPLLLWLSVSCVAKPSTTDTLAFTSGVRAILQDSKGNYWFGSHSEGVGYFNGKTFEYFTTQEGIYRYDGQQLNYVAFPTPKVSPTGNTYAVTSFSKGKNNMLWIGTYAGVWGNNGIGVLLKEADTITHFPKEQGKLTPAPPSRICHSRRQGRQYLVWRPGHRRMEIRWHPAYPLHD